MGWRFVRIMPLVSRAFILTGLAHLLAAMVFVEGNHPRPGLAVAALLLLNVGVPLAAFGGSTGVATMVQVGRLARLAGALSFGAHAWPRLRYGGLIGRIRLVEDAT